MNKQNAHSYVHLINALVNGQTIQTYNIHTCDWIDNDEVLFALPANNYRVKEESNQSGLRHVHIDVLPTYTRKSAHTIMKYT